MKIYIAEVGYDGTNKASFTLAQAKESLRIANEESECGDPKLTFADYDSDVLWHLFFSADEGSSAPLAGLYEPCWTDKYQSGFAGVIKALDVGRLVTITGEEFATVLGVDGVHTKAEVLSAARKAWSGDQENDEAGW